MKVPAFGVAFTLVATAAVLLLPEGISVADAADPTPALTENAAEIAVHRKDEGSKAPPLMRRSERASLDHGDEDAHMIDDDEDLEDQAQSLLPGASLVSTASGDQARLHRKTGKSRHATGSLQTDSLEDQSEAEKRAEFQALVDRLQVEGEEEAFSMDASEMGHHAARTESEDDLEDLDEDDDSGTTTTTTTTGCFDRPASVAPIFKMDGASQECSNLKQFCEGAGDKSIYVALKCPLTCMTCEASVIPDPTGEPRETHCFRRRRWGYCYSRRRRYD
mmetsp:Transcript_98756/g.205848  ORF Transcript_98756/g.205848 Transcript_98756/m.205848 type:complete len:277 (-) Transcript_98756:128-958(-)